MKHLILGVDPGITGAIAFLDIEKKRAHTVIDMPTVQVRDKKRLDLHALAIEIDGLAAITRFAVIEEVGARPGDGVTGMFNFGYSSGAVAGIVAASMIPIFMVKPAIWKMLMGLGYVKDESRDLATKFYPLDSGHWARKKDHGRAEALLLAHYGASRFTV